MINFKFKFILYKFILHKLYKKFEKMQNEII